MRENPIRVFLVDDQILMRRGLRKLLEVEDGIEVVGEAPDGVEALLLVPETQLPKDLGDVVFRRTLGDIEAMRYLPVGGACAHEL